MAKDLQTLIRLHQYRVDDKRRALGELLGEVSQLEQQSEKLEREIVLEQEVANSAPDSVGMFYGDYATTAVGKREDLANAIGEMEERIAIAQEEMRAEFNSLKVFEITQEARDVIAADEEQKEEQAILDELGLEAYRRRQRTEHT